MNVSKRFGLLLIGAFLSCLLIRPALALHHSLANKDFTLAAQSIDSSKDIDSATIAAPQIGSNSSPESIPSRRLEWNDASFILLIAIVVLTQGTILCVFVGPFLRNKSDNGNTTLGDRANYLKTVLPGLTEALTVILIISVLGLVLVLQLPMNQGVVSLFSAISGYILGKSNRTELSLRAPTEKVIEASHDTEIKNISASDEADEVKR